MKLFFAYMLKNELYFKEEGLGPFKNRYKKDSSERWNAHLRNPQDKKKLMQIRKFELSGEKQTTKHSRIRGSRWAGSGRSPGHEYLLREVTEAEH